MTRTLNNKELLKKHDIIEWLKEYLLNKDKPDNLAFITIKFNHKPNDPHKICKTILFPIFELLSGRKWQKYIKGIVITEHGHYGNLHCHCILNTGDKTTEELTLVADSLVDNPKSRFTVDYKNSENDVPYNYTKGKHHILIEPMNTLQDLTKTAGYSIKEYNFRQYRLDFSNFATLTMMSNRVINPSY